MGCREGKELITSLRSNVDQYFSKFIERSNVNNFVERLSCVGKAKVSKIEKLSQFEHVRLSNILSIDSKLLISVDFNDC